MSIANYCQAGFILLDCEIRRVFSVACKKRVTCWGLFAEWRLILSRSSCVKTEMRQSDQCFTGCYRWFWDQSNPDRLESSVYSFTNLYKSYLDFLRDILWMVCIYSTDFYKYESPPSPVINYWYVHICEKYIVQLTQFDIANLDYFLSDLFIPQFYRRVRPPNPPSYFWKYFIWGWGGLNAQC